MTPDEVMSTLRQLAKSNYYQALYKQAKEIHLKIFENDFNLTDLQIHFLGYLSFYSNLYLDCATGEVDEIVLKDEIYEDAYFAYKISQMKRDDDEFKAPEIVSKKNPLEYTEKIGESSWVFRGTKPTKK